MIDTPPELTVIIVTRDRADDLKNTSLPSLAAQTCHSFDVLVWDASNSDHSRNTVVRAGLEHPWMHVHYVRAPRKGTACQRNDALDACTSELVLYIDDDAELFPNAIAELLRVFRTDTSARIGGCQCAMVSAETDRRAARRIRNAVWQVWHSFWGMWYNGRRQAIRLSGFNTALYPLSLKTAARKDGGMPARTDLEWLQGCAMAFRRSILTECRLRFDERLMRFGDYCKCEDVLFSGTLHLRYGYDLACAPSSFVVHRPGSGPHGVTEHQPAMIVYNHWLVWSELASTRRWAHLALWWARTGLWLRYVISALLSGRWNELLSFREGLQAARAAPGDS